MYWIEGLVLCYERCGGWRVVDCGHLHVCLFLSLIYLITHLYSTRRASCLCDCTALITHCLHTPAGHPPAAHLPCCLLPLSHFLAPPIPHCFPCRDDAGSACSGRAVPDAGGFRTGCRRVTNGMQACSERDAGGFRADPHLWSTAIVPHPPNFLSLFTGHGWKSYGIYCDEIATIPCYTKQRISHG